MVATSFKSSNNQPFSKPSLASPYISKLLPSIPPNNQPFNIIPSLCAAKKEEERSWTCLLSNMDRWNV